MASSVYRDKARRAISPNEAVIAIDSLAFEEGDLLLRRGNSIVSGMIVQAFPGGGGMSHCGILIQENGAWQVIHSISGAISDSEGIRKQAWLSFARNAKEARLLHVKPTFVPDRQAIRAKAFVYLQRRTGFDHDFDLSNDSKLYCSELVRAVYQGTYNQDPFLYRDIGPKSVIDMASFFQDDFWLRHPAEARY
jgi:hypothetical protein